MSQVLIGVDASPPSFAALEHGARLAAQLGASVVLCHAVSPMVAAGMLTPAMLGDVLEAARSEGAALLERDAEWVRRSGVKAETVLELGDPADCLAALAQAAGVEMVVVGSHGRGPVGRLLMGSVSDRVTHLCTKPVLVVHGPPEPAEQHEVVPLRS